MAIPNIKGVVERRTEWPQTLRRIFNDEGTPVLCRALKMKEKGLHGTERSTVNGMGQEATLQHSIVIIPTCGAT